MAIPLQSDNQIFLSEMSSYLFVTEVFKDILICGPSISSGENNGGETDNWRHTYDMNLIFQYSGSMRIKENQLVDYSIEMYKFSSEEFFD